MAPPQFVMRLIAPQLAHPRGLGGRIVAALMNRSNARMNAFTVDALAVHDGDRVVDLGFGGGPNLVEFARRVGSGEVVGVEMSTTMLARASTTFAPQVASGRLRLLEGTIESLPLGDRSVDGLCTVNTVYFWKDRIRAMAELRRVMRPGGRVAVTFLPKAAMESLGVPTHIFRYTPHEEVEAMLRDAGFVDVRVLTAPEPGDRWCCVRAVAPV